MRLFGIIAAGIAGTAGMVGVILGIRSVPDLKRYLRMRSM